MSVKYSFIIPFFNSKKFLARAIKSIIKQKKLDIEIILVDDCSSDNSYEVANYFKKKYPFIKIIKNKTNLGVGISRNKALKRASGEFLIFLDSDDELFDNSLTGLSRAIKNKKNADLIVLKHKKTTYPQTNIKLIQDLNNLNYSPRLFIHYLLKSKLPFADCWFFCVKNNLIRKNNIMFPPSRFGESEFFVLQVLLKIKSFSCNKSFFYKKNDRLNSLNSSVDLNATKSVIINLIYLNNIIKRNNIDNNQKKLVKHYIKENLGLINSLLMFRSDKEITLLKKFVSRNSKSLKISNITLGKDFFKIFTINSKNRSLKSYKKKIETKIFKKVENLINKNTNIYLYCNSRFSSALNNLLIKKGFNARGIIDDSNVLRKSKYSSLRSFNYSGFSKDIKNKSEICVMICHQKEIIANKIYSNLLKKKFKKNQLVKIKF